MVRNAGSYILALALFSQLVIATLSAGVNPTTSAAAAPTTSAAAAPTTSAASNPTTSVAVAPTTSAGAAPTTSAAAAAPTTSAAAAAPTTSAAAPTTSAAAAASTSFSAAPSSTLMVSSSNIKSSSQVLPSASLPSMDASASSVASSIASASATPRLSSTMISSSPILYSSSVMPSIVSSSALPFITPSRTAVIASESIQIKDKNNKTCLTAKLEVDFTIFFYTKVNNTIQQQKTIIPLNGDNTTRMVNGSCSISERNANFNISWNEYGDVSGPHHIFTMKFILSNTTHEWSVPGVSVMFQTADSRFDGYYKNDSSINAALPQNATSVFGSTHNGTNYVCNGGVKQQMTSNVTAMFKQIILQPFSDDPDLKKKGKHCAADKSPDDDDNTVPIAVGAALGGLVLIVLIAYVVGRRRSNRGYEQV